MNIRSKIFITSCVIVGVVIAVVFNTYLGPVLISRGNTVLNSNDLSSIVYFVSSKKQHSKQMPAQIPSAAGASFIDNFDTSYTVKEAGNMSESTSPSWWVSSGAYFYSRNGVGITILGELSFADPWRVAFSIANPLDTDNGYHPQNIFRLVFIKNQWQNFRQEAYFQIIKDNLSVSPNRNASNGLLFFNRYQDAFNLYYTGIRVDGYAVIKKKINGTYYTMAYKPFIKGLAYNRDSNPDLLPKNTWIGLRSEIKTDSSGVVNIRLYVDNGKTGNWVLAAEAKDDGKIYGNSPILKEGYVGVRTDFMDVELDGYTINSL